MHELINPKMRWHPYGYICLPPFDDRLRSLLLGVNLGTNRDYKVTEILFSCNFSLKQKYFN